MSETVEESKALSTMLAIHEQVKAFVERECNCKVTSIRGSSISNYTPPMHFNRYSVPPQEIKDVEFHLMQVDMSFRVDAVSLEKLGLDLSIQVGVVSTSSLESKFMIMRQTGVM